MKKLFIIILCFCSILSFAQNGFFIQTEFGKGFSKARVEYISYTGDMSEYKKIVSYGGQVDIGYQIGKWQLISGIGYLQTGVNMQGEANLVDVFNKYNPDWAFYNKYFMPYTSIDKAIIDYNPHFIIPVKI